MPAGSVPGASTERPDSFAAVARSGTSYGFGGVDQVSVPNAPNPLVPLRSLTVIGTAATCLGSKIVMIDSATPLTVSAVATSATVAAAARPFVHRFTRMRRGAG